MPVSIAKHPPARTVRQRRSAISECLEARRMLFGFTIDGTSGSDSISIGISGNDILYVVNGVSDTRSNSLFDEVTINCLGGNDSVSIIATSDNLITVLGGAGNDTIRAGNGGNDLTVISRNLVVNGGADTDLLGLHDAARSGPTSYTLGGSTFDSPFHAAITFPSVEQVELNTGIDNNFLDVTSLPTANVKFLPGANGSFGDTLSLEGLATELITVRPSATTTGSHIATWGARTIEGVNVETMTVQTARLSVITPNNNDTISIQGSTILGTSDAVTLGKISADSVASFFLDVAANDTTHSTDIVGVFTFEPPSGKLDLNAGGGTNTLTLNTEAVVDTGFGTQAGNFLDVIVNASTVDFDGFQSLKSLRLQSLSNLRFIGSGNLMQVGSFSTNASGNNVIRDAGQSMTITGAFAIDAGGSLSFNGPGSTTFAASVANSHAVDAAISVNGGIVTFNSDLGSVSSRNAGLTTNNAASVVLRSDQHLRFLTMFNGTVRTERGQTPVVLVTGSLNIIDGGARLDLADDAMILDYTGASPLNAIRADVLSGRNGGTWNGTGINSSAATLDPNTAIGFGEITDLLGPIGGGVTFLGDSVDDTTIVLRHTLLGDADLDHAVGFGDLLILAQNYNATGSSWTRGNFDFDASSDVGFGDLLILAQQYGQSLLANASGPGTIARSRQRAVSRDLSRALSRAFSVVE